MIEKMSKDEKEIEKFLLDCGFRADLAGFEVLRECIRVASINKTYYKANIHGTLLNEVKEKFGFSTTGQCTALIRTLSRNCTNPKYQNLSAKKIIFTLITELGCK